MKLSHIKYQRTSNLPSSHGGSHGSRGNDSFQYIYNVKWVPFFVELWYYLFVVLRTQNPDSVCLSFQKVDRIHASLIVCIMCITDIPGTRINICYFLSPNMNKVTLLQPIHHDRLHIRIFIATHVLIFNFSLPFQCATSSKTLIIMFVTHNCCFHWLHCENNFVFNSITFCDSCVRFVFLS